MYERADMERVEGPIRNKGQRRKTHGTKLTSTPGRWAVGRATSDNGPFGGKDLHKTNLIFH